MMQSNVNTPASWAEAVPDAPYPMRVADLASLPDDGWHYEIVEGRLVRMPGSGIKASWIAMRLSYFLMNFVIPRNLGIVTGADGTYDLTRPGDPTETALIPDAAFVQAGRFPPMNTPAAAKYGKLAPDLVAEVVSPSQDRKEMDDKARLYIERGVRLAWIIWPDAQEVDLWRPTLPTTPVKTLGLADSLDGLDVLPGFALPIRDLFNL
ncbi:MAG TPA: Uma2 family endonuclease [Ktedonobacterales bacterium]|nr:Uma2 family endonuclease [Ktedonobacterales bacterium]